MVISARREDCYPGSGGAVIRLRSIPTGRIRRPLRQAADILRAGGIVAFPTDTFYGLAVDPRLDAAVASAVTIKGRDPASRCRSSPATSRKRSRRADSTPTR